MGAVTESGTLLVGTNTFAILTQSITDWVNFDRDADDYSNMLGDEEERKGDYDDSEFGEVGRVNDVDDEIEQIRAAHPGMTLDQIMNLNEEIMARDAYNNQAAAQQAYQ